MKRMLALGLMLAGMLVAPVAARAGGAFGAGPSVLNVPYSGPSVLAVPHGDEPSVLGVPRRPGEPSVLGIPQRPFPSQFQHHWVHQRQPAWVQPQWAWNGWQWVWVPGYWAW